MLSAGRIPWLTPPRSGHAAAPSASTSVANGALWTGGGIVGSTLALLVANLVLVANTTPAVFADFAVLTVSLLMLATVLRVGADRVFIGEVHMATDEWGPEAGTVRGAQVTSFSVMAGLVGGLLVAWSPLSTLIDHSLSEPLSSAERAFVGLWLMSDISRLVIAEGHRWGLQFKLAAFAGTGARGPIFLVLVLCVAFSGKEVTREHVLSAAAVASASVFVIALLKLGQLFPWWASNPFASARDLWRSHTAMLITTLAATVVGAADVWIVGTLIGPEPAARYAFSVSLVAGIAIVSSAISLGLSPLLAGGMRSERLEETSSVVSGLVRAGGGLAILIYIGLLALAEPLAVRLGGDAYRGVFPLVVLLGAGQLVGVLAGPGGTALIVARQYQLITLITVGVALAMLLLTLAAAWLTGSAVLVALASGTATGGLHVISAGACRRRLGIRVHLSRHRLMPPTVPTSP